MLNFFKNYGLVKAESVAEGVVNLAAAIDAEGVSETAIRQKMDEHDALVKQLVAAQNDFRKEKAEADEIKALYDRKMAAAERAQADLDKDPNNADAATALGELLEDLEKMAPRVEKEAREAADAESFMNQMKVAADEIAAELKTLRETLNDVKRDIKEAEIEAQRQKKRAEQAAVVAGLKKSSDKFGVAMNALKAQADAKKAEADAAKIKAEQLAPKPVSSAASKYMSDAAPTTAPESLQDRLARLKNKAA